MTVDGMPSMNAASDSPRLLGRQLRRVARLSRELVRIGQRRRRVATRAALPLRQPGIDAAAQRVPAGNPRHVDRALIVGGGVVGAPAAADALVGVGPVRWSPAAACSRPGWRRTRPGRSGKPMSVGLYSCRRLRRSPWKNRLLATCVSNTVARSYASSCRRPPSCSGTDRASAARRTPAPRRSSR